MFGCLRQNFCKLDSLRWFSQRRRCRQVCARCVRSDVSPASMAFLHFVIRRDSAKRHPHFWGSAPRRGLWLPNLNSAEIFVRRIYPRSEVIVLTNKPTNPSTHKQTNRRRRKHPTFFATLRRWVNRTQVATNSYTEMFLYSYAVRCSKCTHLTSIA